MPVPITPFWTCGALQFLEPLTKVPIMGPILSSACAGNQLPSMRPSVEVEDTTSVIRTSVKVNFALPGTHRLLK